MRLESTGKFWRVFSTAVLGLALTACGIANSNTAMPGAQQPIDTTAATACAPFGASYIRTTLYFGLSHPSGVVSDASWQSFLRDEITPRFPNGLTVWEADGQWRGADGALVRERTKVVSLVHADTAPANAALGAIVEGYKRKFEQESVLRETARVCAAA
jgi:hypothetical protein